MATFEVTNGNDSGINSLRWAIEQANISPGIDDVFVQADVELTSAIRITESVNIGTPGGATITQTNNDRIFYIQDGNTETKADVSLYRLNLTGGNGFIGGAIISYENLSITDSSLYNNSAVATGAAVYVANSSLIVERTDVYDNEITSNPDITDEDLFVFEGELEIVNPSSELSATEPAIEAIEEEAIEEEPTESAEDLTDNNANSDVVEGSAEDNYVLEESDRLLEDAGDDSAEVNSLDGSAGNDLLQGTNGKNFLFGNDGNDRLIGGEDIDYLNGGAGDDDLYSGDGDDTLSGEVGDDTLDGAAGADTLMGGDGNDWIRGAAGNDVIHGHAGNDFLIGGEDDDIIHGDEGDDTLNGDRGDNFLIGGSGSDVFYLNVEGNSAVADFELGTDRLQLASISLDDLDITGGFNSYLYYQGTQIGMVMGVDSAQLSAENFIEV